MYTGGMSVAIQIKDVPEEVRDTLAARAAARGQSTQAYLRAVLEREFHAERNRKLLESLAENRSLTASIDDVVAEIRRYRESDDA